MELRLSGGLSKQRFIYSKHFRLLLHGADLYSVGCTRTAIEEVHLQLTLSSNLCIVDEETYLTF